MRTLDDRIFMRDLSLHANIGTITGLGTFIAGSETLKYLASDNIDVTGVIFLGIVDFLLLSQTIRSLYNVTVLSRQYRTSPEEYMQRYHSRIWLLKYLLFTIDPDLFYNIRDDLVRRIITDNH